MASLVQNLFSDVPSGLSEELVDVLAANDYVRIERIVSNGQSSVEGFWYDQAETEWVIVLSGEAKLLFEGESAPRHLKPGDHVTIPPHRKHCVQWTAAKQPTVWLAVFF